VGLEGEGENKLGEIQEFPFIQAREKRVFLNEEYIKSSKSFGLGFIDITS